MGLLFAFANLQPTHTRLYSRERRWFVGALIFAVATLIPPALMFYSRGLPFVSGAVGSLLLGS